MSTKTAEHVKLARRFDQIRKKRSETPCEDRLDQPLAFWVREGDKRLPTALLDRSLRDLLETDFGDLEKTPGVGEKKTRTLVALLRRALDAPPPADATGDLEDPPKETPSCQGFDYRQISDDQWRRLCAKVKRFGLEQETIGRLAPCLQDVPTVIWQTRLGQYADYSLDELRRLRNHGAKRVRVIVEVFHTAGACLGSATCNGHLSVRLLPQIAVRLEEWIAGCFSQPGIPDARAVRRELTVPLVKQSRHDLGATIAELAAQRLGVDGRPTSIQQLATRTKLTRARIYQLLDQCAAMMDARWPEGAMQLQALQRRLEDLAASKANRTALSDFRSTCEMFFPDAVAAAKSE